MQKPKMNKNKEKSIKRLEARGFAWIDNTTMGTTMGLVDGDGFFQKVVVNRTGVIKRYKPIKAREFHKQRLPHSHEPFQVLPNGNFV